MEHPKLILSFSFRLSAEKGRDWLNCNLDQYIILIFTRINSLLSFSNLIFYFSYYVRTLKFIRVKSKKLAKISKRIGRSVIGARRQSPLSVARPIRVDRGTAAASEDSERRDGRANRRIRVATANESPRGRWGEERGSVGRLGGTVRRGARIFSSTFSGEG